MVTPGQASIVVVGFPFSDISFARPTKLFTAHESLMTKRVAILNAPTFKEIVLTTIRTFQKFIPK